MSQRPKVGWNWKRASKQAAGEYDCKGVPIDNVTFVVRQLKKENKGVITMQI